MKGSKLSVTSNVKDLGVEVADNLTVNSQCTTSKANRMLGMIKSIIANKKPDTMLRLYKTLVSTSPQILHNCMVAQLQKDKDLLEKIQKSICEADSQH